MKEIQLQKSLVEVNDNNDSEYMHVPTDSEEAVSERSTAATSSYDKPYERRKKLDEKDMIRSIAAPNIYVKNTQMKKEKNLRDHMTLCMHASSVRNCTVTFKNILKASMR